MKSLLFRCALVIGIIFLFSALLPPAWAEGVAEFRPALVGNGPKSLVNQIDLEKLMRQGQGEAVVMFDAVVGDYRGGSVLQYNCYGSPDSKALQQEISKRLKNCAFIPALAHGKAVDVFFRGAVVFAVRGGRPQLQIFANQAPAELARGSDYIQPQLIMGTDDWDDAQPYLEVVRRHWRHGIAVVSLAVDARGKRGESHLVKEEPKGLNLGAAVLKIFSTARFIPAFRNGKPVATIFEMSDVIYGRRYHR
ncbi:MAG: hypothetical protein ACR2G0_08735 [Chthoniobacterales bacterium]